MASNTSGVIVSLTFALESVPGESAPAETVSCGTPASWGRIVGGPVGTAAGDWTLLPLRTSGAATDTK